MRVGVRVNWTNYAENCDVCCLFRFCCIPLVAIVVFDVHDALKPDVSAMPFMKKTPFYFYNQRTNARREGNKPP
jgi:hypothetical protein